MPDKEYQVNFVCPNPNCDSGVVDEIMIRVTQSSPITDIFELSDDFVVTEYSNNCSYDGGVVTDYRCSECGYVLRTELSDIPISTPEELFDWLEKHNMLKERP